MILNVGNARGRHKLEEKATNRAAIINFFKNNPGSSISDCARALNICYATVSKHLEEIKEAE